MCVHASACVCVCVGNKHDKHREFIVRLPQQMNLKHSIVKQVTDKNSEQDQTNTVSWGTCPGSFIIRGTRRH